MENKREIPSSELIAMKEIRKNYLSMLPTDWEVAEWYDLNIDPNDATVSSAIYKFRLWLKDRGQFQA